MEKWFFDFQSNLTEQFPWMAKYVTEDGSIREEQFAGDSAQDVADYVRKVNGQSTTIYFIAKLDNTWS